MREEVEKLLAELGRQRRELEAEAGHAAEQLARLTGGITPLEDVDYEPVRAAADTFSDALARLALVQQFARDLRRLLM
jgi:hypothetical protein